MTAQKGRAKNSVARLWPFGPDLLPRLLSAIVLIPLTAIALVAGWIPFALLIALVMAGAYREWESMIAGRQSPWPTVFILGLLTLIAGFMVATALAFLLEFGRRTRGAHGDDFQEYQRLRREALADLRSPVRALRRQLGAGPNGGPPAAPREPSPRSTEPV